MNNKNLKIARFAADKIHEKVTKALSGKDTNKRWFWELLQNAKDTVVSSKGSVDVRVVADFNKNQQPFIRFEHNGGVFKYSNHELKFDDPECLILPNSGKIEEDESQREDITGQFGTGFLSTHILSLKILVESIFLSKEGDYYDFSFTLDRNYINQFDLARKVEQALDEYEKKFTKNSNPDLLNFHTKFTYLLDENKEGLETGLAVAQKGLEDLVACLPFALAFCKEIKSVEIIDNINTQQITTYTRKNILEKQDNKVQIIEISKDILDIQRRFLDKETIEIAMHCNFVESIDVAVKIQKKEQSYKICQIDKNSPVLFCAFPLIGSEKWRYPVVLNCTKFYPTEPRDGILLLDEKDNGNQTRIENSLNSFLALLDFAVTQQWDDLHLLADTLYEVCPEWASEKWYKEILKNIRYSLHDKPIVTNERGNKIALKEALFPSYPGKEKLDFFWEICNNFKGDKIPRKRDVAIWCKFINADYASWGTNFKYDLKTLLTDIQTSSTLKQLASNFFANNEQETIQWLNEVIAFVFEQAEEPELLKNIKIIPNQLGEFSTIDKLITDEDQRIPDELKDILIGLSNDDWRKILMHTDILCKLPEIQKRGVSEISGLIDKHIEANQNPEIVRKAVYKLISLYSTEFTDKENSEMWRKTLWRLAKDLDNNVPDIQELAGLIPKIWEKTDKWIFNTLVNDIKDIDTERLRIKLSVETKEQAVIWLNEKFIQFYEINQKTTFYSDKAIFPNQQGLFRKQTELFFDKIQHDDLKKVLQKLGVNWYFILLDKNITSIKNFDKERPRTILDISNKINAVIKEKSANPTDEFKNAIYDLVRILPNNDFSERKRLLEFSHTIYPDKISEMPTIIDNLNDFEFSLCNEWILIELVKEVQSAKNIISLQSVSEKLQTKSEDELIKWIDNFISFVSSFENNKHRNLLEKFAIIPNQNKNFCTIKFLKKDNNIPDDLKEIASGNYINHNWNDELLHKKLDQTSYLFDENNTRNIEHIAKQIDSAVREYKNYPFEAYFSELLFALNQSETAHNDRDEKKLFPFFLSHKDRLIVGTLGDKEKLSNVSKLIQNPDKLAILAIIAGNKDISHAQLEAIAKITKTVDMGTIVELAKKEEKSELRKQFFTKLGTHVEKIFATSFDANDFKVEREEIGQDYDIVDIKKDTRYHVEIKSISANKDFVRMTKWQGKNATLKKDVYVLCVLQKETPYPDENYFKEHAKFVTDIGYQLDEKVKEAETFEAKNFDTGMGNIRIDFEVEDYKFRIYKEIWENGLTWQQFNEMIIKK